MPSVEGALDGVEQRLLAGGVALGAGQAPPLGPPPVAVHDAGNVGGYAGGVDPGGEHPTEATARRVRNEGGPPAPGAARHRREAADARLDPSPVPLVVDAAGRARAGERRRRRAAVVVDRPGRVPVPVPAAAAGDRRAGLRVRRGHRLPGQGRSRTWASRARPPTRCWRSIDTAEGSRRAASVIGILGLAWSSLGRRRRAGERPQRHLAGHRPGDHGQARRGPVAGRRRPAVPRLGVAGAAAQLAARPGHRGRPCWSGR